MNTSSSQQGAGSPVSTSSTGASIRVRRLCPHSAMAAGLDDGLPSLIFDVQADVLVRVLSFLGHRDLSRLSQTCRALRFVPSHFELWKWMFLKRFPALAAPKDGHWKRAYHQAAYSAVHLETYQREMTLGLLGRQAPLPLPLEEPRVDLYALGPDGSNRPLSMMAARRFRAKTRNASSSPRPASLCRTSEVSSSGTLSDHGREPSSTGAGDEPKPAGILLRQGSANWSALGAPPSAD
jgi:hypothetical protein